MKGPASNQPTKALGCEARNPRGGIIAIIAHPLPKNKEDFQNGYSE